MKFRSGVLPPGRSAAARLVVATLTSLIAATASAAPDGVLELGQALFFDSNLSAARTQSCASCHDPAYAFRDPRDNGVAGAVSLGGDGRSLGDRNAPSLAYAARVPILHRDGDGHYRGGFFHDGRAPGLADQAVEPITNPIEMALPDAAAILDRIRENERYVNLLGRAYGTGILGDPAATRAAIGAAIAKFESSELFMPFDSRYDRYLRGEYELTPLEEAGRSLFFSPLTNCSSCHLHDITGIRPGETFSNNRYHNIGLPVNTAVRERNGLGTDYRDPGLLANPAVDDASLAGKFRVPSLRNVAVTAPYMHNGIFQRLETAIVFYNQYMVRSRQSLTNPETGEPWGAAEFPDTIDTSLLSQGQPIDEGRTRALVAFLKTLTDARYEHLLQTETAGIANPGIPPPR